MCYHTRQHEAAAAMRQSDDGEGDVRDEEATAEYRPEEHDPEPDATEARPKPLGFA